MKQGDALESLLASGGIEPLAEGVGSAAGASGAERDGLQAERERDVGVGGGALQLGVDAKMGIDGLDGRQQRRGGGQLAGRTLADHGDGVLEAGGGVETSAPACRHRRRPRPGGCASPTRRDGGNRRSGDRP